jgi:long-chain acyl-CoA synthetase
MLVVPRLLKLFHDSINQQVDASGPFMRAMFHSLHRLSEVSGRRLGRQLFATVHKKFGGRLRLFVSGAAALDAELFHSFQRMGFAVAEGYGLTETSPVLTVNPTGAARAGSAGRPLPNVQLEIRGAGPDGVGELWARGPNVMPGYLNDAESTRTVVENGWFRTGDLCRTDSDGYVYIAGRAKDLIVTEAGKNVYPDEVEVRYRGLPYVSELCVVGVPNDSRTGEAVHAVVVMNGEGDWKLIEREILSAAENIARHVPSHQRIQTFHFWSGELPKTSTMKAKRAAIRDAIVNGRAGTVVRRQTEEREPGPRPATAVTVPENQRFVIETLSRLTHTPEPDIHAESNLLQDLGVDSLMKLYVVAEIEKHYGFTCSDEEAAAVERVKDLLSLVGNRAAISHTGDASKSWKTRLHRSRTNGANGAAADDRPLPLPLQPARWAVQGGVSLFFNSYVRIRASGLNHIPANGPFVLAANHTSHLDAASVLTAIGGRRRVWVAAAEDYFFDTPLKSWVFGRLFDTVPIDRNAGGVSGLRGCLKRLEAGDGVLVLPEGTRSVTGRIQEFKIGVAVLALEANAPVIPTRIDHAYDLLPKGKRFVRPGTVQVTFGEPISPSAWSHDGDIEAQHRAYQAMTREIQSCVESLGGG